MGKKRVIVKYVVVPNDMLEMIAEVFFYSANSANAKTSPKPEKIHTGDIMLYGSDCLVLFYDDFSTSYSYTPVGSINNPDGLAKALGSGDVYVSFL